MHSYNETKNERLAMEMRFLSRVDSKAMLSALEVLMREGVMHTKLRKVLMNERLRNLLMLLANSRHFTEEKSLFSIDWVSEHFIAICGGVSHVYLLFTALD